jgi:predicted amidophosphoribosyltransferase
MSQSEVDFAKTLIQAHLNTSILGMDEDAPFAHAIVNHIRHSVSEQLEKKIDALTKVVLEDNKALRRKVDELANIIKDMKDDHQVQATDMRSALRDATDKITGKRTAKLSKRTIEGIQVKQESAQPEKKRRGRPPKPKD